MSEEKLGMISAAMPPAMPRPITMVRLASSMREVIV